MHAPFWTEARVELLTEMWKAGHSASRCAVELGVVTRNAVIGKVHRLGLSGRGQPSSSIKRRRRSDGGAGRIAKPRTAHSAPPAIVGFSHKPEPAPLRAEPVVPADMRKPKMLPLDKLTERTCKWPIGDPGELGFGFCGNEREPGRMPYCSRHKRKAVVGSVSLERELEGR